VDGARFEAAEFRPDFERKMAEARGAVIEKEEDIPDEERL
jgi:hypothetical protein